MTQIDYYFSLTSPWSFMGGEKLAKMAEAHGATVNCIPANLGAVFAETGGLPLPKRSPQRQAYRMMGEAAPADDITQEAFISAFRKLRSYRGGSFKAWLFGIAWRKCQEHHRRRYRHQEATGEVARLQHARQDGDAVEKQAYQQELLDCVQRQWRLLSEDRREVLLLRFWAGLNTAETAELMGRRRGAVKMLLSRAIADIRERCLDE